MISPRCRQSFPAGLVLLLSLLLIPLLAGCEGEEPAPPPTIASLFNTPTPRPSATPRPTSTRPPTLTPTPTPQLETLVIYDDTLAPGWSFAETRNMFFDPESTAYVYDGRYALEITPRLAVAAPQEELSARFYVTLQQEGGRPIRKDEILKLSFYLNPGDNIILEDDLGVALQGSNDFPYWAAGDESARSGPGPIFSETILFFLDIRNQIPADTWVPVEVYPGELLFDPNYEYFTGFYIINGVEFLQPFYVDQIELTLIVDES